MINQEAETELLPRPTRGGFAVANVAEAATLGEIVFKSKLFPDTASAAAAVVKILAGAEMGFGPVASLADVHLIEGKPVIGAHLQAAAVRRSGRYDYRILKLDDTGCELEFLALRGGKWEVQTPTISFTVQEAKDKGISLAKSGALKDNWRKFPANMCFARAMTNGVKFHCPDLLAGVVAYDVDEIEARPTPVATSLVSASTQPIQDAEIVNPTAPVPDLDKPVTQNQLDVIQSHLLRLNISPAGLKARLLDRFKIDSVEKLTRGQANQILEGLMSKEKK